MTSCSKSSSLYGLNAGSIASVDGAVEEAQVAHVGVGRLCFPCGVIRLESREAMMRRIEAEERERLRGAHPSEAEMRAEVRARLLGTAAGAAGSSLPVILLRRG